jgi:hypothetical protein
LYFVVRLGSISGSGEIFAAVGRREPKTNVKVVITQEQVFSLITIIFSSHTRPVNSLDRKTNV